MNERIKELWNQSRYPSGRGHEVSRETRDKISKLVKEYNHEKTSECESNSRN